MKAFGVSLKGVIIPADIKPNVRTYTALITALGNGRQWNEAFTLIQRMRGGNGQGGVEPNAYTYSALLKAMGEQVHTNLPPFHMCQNCLEVASPKHVLSQLTVRNPWKRGRRIVHALHTGKFSTPQVWTSLTVVLGYLNYTGLKSIVSRISQFMQGEWQMAESLFLMLESEATGTNCQATSLTVSPSGLTWFLKVSSKLQTETEF